MTALPSVTMVRAVDINNTNSQRMGATVRAARVALGLTQQALADRIGVSRGMVAKWELGRKNLTWPRAHQVAEALGTTVANLARRAEQVSTPAA